MRREVEQRGVGRLKGSPEPSDTQTGVRRVTNCHPRSRSPATVPRTEAPALYKERRSAQLIRMSTSAILHARRSHAFLARAYRRAKPVKQEYNMYQHAIFGMFQTNSGKTTTRGTDNLRKMYCRCRCRGQCASQRVTDRRKATVTGKCEA